MVHADNGLSGQVAIVTGASRGIGRASALALARKGAAIVAVSLPSEAELLERLAAAIADAGSKCISVEGDVRNADTAGRAVSAAMERFARVDILLNNVGIGKYTTITESTIKDYEEIMDTNMRSTFLFTSAVVPVMKNQGRGLILQIASQSGLRGFPAEAIYCASKHAQVGFTRALRLELQPYGIKVAAICPARVKTDFAIGRGRTAEFMAQADSLEPEDVADAVVFAATQSPAARMTEVGLISLGEPI